MSIVQQELSVLTSPQLFLIFVNIVELLGTYQAHDIQAWYDAIEAVPAPPETRESVLFVEPCIKEFLQKLAEKKRMMT